MLAALPSSTVAAGSAWSAQSGLGNGAETVRVFLVAASAAARLGLRRMIESPGVLEVVGEASSGRAALRLIPELKPSIVLIDVRMPGLDGLETTRRLMAEHPLPIVLISDLVGQRAELNFQALDAGALDLLRKPTRDELEDPTARAHLTRRLRVLAPVPLVTRRRQRQDRPAASASAEPAASGRAAESPAESLAPLERLSIGGSTGGPVALANFLKSLSAPPPWPIAVVQHMPAGFVHGLAKWLQGECGLPVTVVEERTATRPGHVYLAGDLQHMAWCGGFLKPQRRPLGSLHRPAIDVLFRSAVVSVRPERHAAVLLTGMGSDGARGLLEMRRAGAPTLAQSENTCVVYGMPRAARDLGAASRLLAPSAMGPYLELLSKPRETPN